MTKIAESSNIRLMLLLDCILIASSFVLATSLKLNETLGTANIINAFKGLLLLLPLKLILLYQFRVYKAMWKHMGMVDLYNTVKANTFASISAGIFSLFMGWPENLPSSVFLIDIFISIVMLGGLRAAIRLFLLRFYKSGTLQFRVKNAGKKSLIIIGAGTGGEKIWREIRDNPRLNYNILGFLDDDSSKTGNNIHGMPIIGRVDKLKDIQSKENVDEVIIAVPHATGTQMRRFLDICSDCKVKHRVIPVIEDIIGEKVEVSKFRKINYEDLLGRGPVRLETAQIEKILTEKTVLVSGAGGSIGSELSIQVCQFKPEIIVLCDNTENYLFHAEMNLKGLFPNIRVEACLVDVKNKASLEKVYKRFKPEIVFHTAAYKHVPIMELNPWEAINNNILGTLNMLELSDRFSVQRFVFVSTDKAVRPSNVMGATKRVSEILTQSFSTESKTKFMTVRFGNVIGSNGSVMPIFEKQIARGGPVTVTDEKITRYFMTIQEASQLILQAGAMGIGGEIFILDMGVPVKIADMAKDMIRLSGLEPDVDIEIRYTGLRPGEKLYEELITQGEGIVPTSHEKIMVLRGQIDKKKDIIRKAHKLEELASKFNSVGIKAFLKEVVPEYTPFEMINT